MYVIPMLDHAFTTAHGVIQMGPCSGQILDTMWIASHFANE